MNIYFKYLDLHFYIMVSINHEVVQLESKIGEANIPEWNSRLRQHHQRESKKEVKPIMNWRKPNCE